MANLQKRAKIKMEKCKKMLYCSIFILKVWFKARLTKLNENIIKLSYDLEGGY